MLSRTDLRRWVDRFATSEPQIRRDHLISHVLAHLPKIACDAAFFGGTALCRTHLPDWRLSEDVDLLVGDMTGTVRILSEALPLALRREFPGASLEWSREGETRVGLLHADDLLVRLQLIARDVTYEHYPTATIAVALRYEDLAPTAPLRCPTRAGASAMKLNAWADRALPRDLCDLFGLARAGLLGTEATDIAARAASPVKRHQFTDDRLPSAETWLTALSRQMAEVPDRVVALRTVREVLADLRGWDIPGEHPDTSGP